MSTSLGALFIPIRAVTDTFRADVDKAAADAGASAGQKFGASFGPALGKIAWGAFATGAAIATKGLVELDSATQQYRATTGATQADVEKMQKTTLDLYRHNLDSIGQITGVLATLRTDLGLTQDQADKAAQSFLNYAKVTGQDDVAAVKAFDDILDAWGLTAADAGGIMDQLVASHQKYGGSIEENQAALAQLGPRLKALGVDINEAIGLLNLFASSGLKADQATGALNVAVTKLKPGQNLSDLVVQVQAIKDPTERAQKAIELFGAKGGVAIANLQGDFHDFEVAPTAAAGAVDKASDAINDSLENKIKLAIKDIGGAFIELSRDGGPVLLAASSIVSLSGALGGPLIGAVRTAGGALIGLAGGHGAAAVAADADAVSQGAAAVAIGSVGVLSGEAIPEILGLAAAEDAGATAGGGMAVAQAGLLASFGPLALLFAAAVGTVNSFTEATNRNSAATDEAADKQGGLYGASARMNNERRKARETADAQTAAETELTKATFDHGSAIDTVTVSAQDNTRRINENAQAHDEAAQITAGYVGTLGQEIGFLGGAAKAASGLTGETERLGGAADDAASAITGLYGDPVAAAFKNLGTALTDEANYLDLVAFKATVAARNLAAMGGAQVAANAANRARLRQVGEDPGQANISGALSHGFVTVPPGDYTPHDVHAELPDAIPTPKGRHGGSGTGSSSSGAGQAKKDAEALAKALHDKVVAAYEEAKKAGDAWYASIHDSKSKAIDDFHDLSRQRIDTEHEVAKATIEDAHRVAKEQFDTERQSIRDRLTERRKLNAEPVTAAEKALQDVQNERRLRDLNEQLALAQQGVDPKALRSAQEALSDFMAQQNINLLRDQQAAADVVAEAEAKASDDDLDTRIKAEDTLHQKQLADEDAAYKVRVDAEDKRYKLAQHDEDVRSQRVIAKFDEHIAAMDDSKKATVALAQAETKRFLQEQLKLAKESGTAQDVRFAQADLDAFLKSLPHKAAGGWVGMKGPELVIEGEDGPEYVVPRASGNSVMQFARGAASAASGQTTNIEVTINNPSPEPASRSAERPLRQIAAGLFG